MRGQPQASPARSGAAGSPRRAIATPPGPGDARRQGAAQPLPDPFAIQICQVPDTAPPYDDEQPGGPGPARADVLAAAITAALDEGAGLAGKPGPGHRWTRWLARGPAAGRLRHRGSRALPGQPARPGTPVPQRSQAQPGRLAPRSGHERPLRGPATGPASSRRCWRRRSPGPGPRPSSGRGRPNAPGRISAGSGRCSRPASSRRSTASSPRCRRPTSSRCPWWWDSAPGSARSRSGWSGPGRGPAHRARRPRGRDGCAPPWRPPSRDAGGQAAGPDVRTRGCAGRRGSA